MQTKWGHTNPLFFHFIVYRSCRSVPLRSSFRGLGLKMEILRSGMWLRDGNSISTSAKCKWRSLPAPMMAPSKTVRMAVADTNGNGNEKSLEAGVADMISSGVKVSDGNKPWWTPLFFNNAPPTSASSPSPSPPNNDKKAKAAGGRKSNVVFTAEKARLLRRELRAAEGWEDDNNMYHSPVASRLAFRLPKRNSL